MYRVQNENAKLRHAHYKHLLSSNTSSQDMQEEVMLDQYMLDVDRFGTVIADHSYGS